MAERSVNLLVKSLIGVMIAALLGFGPMSIQAETAFPAQSGVSIMKSPASFRASFRLERFLMEDRQEIGRS